MHGHTTGQLLHCKPPVAWSWQGAFSCMSHTARHHVLTAAPTSTASAHLQLSLHSSQAVCACCSPLADRLAQHLAEIKLLFQGFLGWIFATVDQPGQLLQSRGRVAEAQGATRWLTIGMHSEHLLDHLSGVSRLEGLLELSPACSNTLFGWVKAQGDCLADCCSFSCSVIKTYKDLINNSSVRNLAELRNLPHSQGKAQAKGIMLEKR